jgi:hypothetical protein
VEFQKSTFVLREFIRQSTPAFANKVFVIFSKHKLSKIEADLVHLVALYKKVEELKKLAVSIGLVK